MYMCLSIHN